jgi:hypothetical protein
VTCLGIPASLFTLCTCGSRNLVVIDGEALIIKAMNIEEAA